MHRLLCRTAALCALSLSVAGLAMAQTATLSGRIVDARSGEPLAGANVHAVGTSYGTVADADGRYRLRLPAGRYTLQVTYIGYAAARAEVTTVAGAAFDRDFSLSEDLVGGDEVVVLGTRRQDRTVVESPVPVDVLGPAEIQATGMTETTQVLQMLVPSYNAPRSSVTDGSDHIRPATLRGLGPDQVLILVNGKRRHTSALVHVNGSVGRGSTGVDLNAIPASAIERIEVLRDGAAAQYGSDAIAGVINIILKEQEGFDAQVTLGQHYSTVVRGYTAGEGNRPTDTATTFNWDDPAEVGGQRIGAPREVTYTDGDALTAHAGFGTRIGPGDGRFYVSGQYRHSDRANRAGLDPRQQYYNGFDYAAYNAQYTEATFDRLNHRYGNGDFDEFSGFANAAVPLGRTNATAYAFGGGSFREGTSGCFYRISQDNRTNRTLYPDGFLPQINSRIRDGSGALGVRGTAGGFGYDLSQTVGANRFNFHMQNTHNASMTNSPTEFNAGTLGFAQATSNLDLYRSVPIGTASPLSVAFGAEFRWDNYTIDRGDEASYMNGGARVADGPNRGAATAVGSQCFPGFQDRSEQDQTRTNVGVYLDLENNLTADLLVSAAARFENYSDFGSTLNGKLAARYELPLGLAVRGAASTGFRAPSLAQAYFTSIATNFIGGVPFEVGTFPVTSPVARALGATDLDAEKSTNLSAGLTLKQDNVVFTADVFQINIKDRITFTENFTGQQVQQFLKDRGINATGGRFFTNALDTRTRGLDLTGRFGLELGPGALRLTLAANWNETEVTNAETLPGNAFNRQITAPQQLRDLGQPSLVGRERLGDYEAAQPRQKQSLQANYEWGRLGLMARVTRYGSVTDLAPQAPDPTTGLNPNDETYGAKAITDAEVTFALPRTARFALGVNNLFDVYPDKVLKFNSNNGIFPYNGFSPFGFFGRYLYTRVSVAF
jgi:iron complex outermembrane recepter protein